MRQVVLDTETTGLEHREGHRIIEIGCVEMIERRLTQRNFHVYINPERPVEGGALEVHGITDEFLADKPKFADVAEEFLDFIRGAELIIHNAAFDVGFLNAELERLDGELNTTVEAVASVLDTLVLARELHPGQRVGLDALCKRYEVDNSNRELHGALLDAELLADVYLAMTGGQVDLCLDLGGDGPEDGEDELVTGLDLSRLVAVQASADERAAHEARLAAIEKASGQCLWPRN
ncbi:DNA polymerase III subunit epsilon [Wenzhouxiangella marina]|uniref:DNA polymerase III subunit epsilon n=1 Tax=Wenzhouxiangella marina TaxID=1579979 RepID=A0A0K0XX39_9GAMM|nr:DNA polymerase III subunit epsilon [Wenzhouxiangella marina]AKS42240.1 DNA polymerase III subunit epsilon [Wenzhouxiangella marina]MBB6085988.1 DNA polymerase-3 subunit epsilon [Wenzhouxiangella marina]